uniref:Uncharacterized protein n=1 Tax=Anopheles melas TaxID=34690 RepID=A0A182UAU4_9DIPT
MLVDSVGSRSGRPAAGATDSPPLPAGSSTPGVTSASVQPPTAAAVAAAVGPPPAPPAVRSTRSRIGFGMNPSSSSSSAVATSMTWSQNDTLFFLVRPAAGSTSDLLAAAAAAAAAAPLLSVCWTTWFSISTSRISSCIWLWAMSYRGLGSCIRYTMPMSRGQSTTSSPLPEERSALGTVSGASVAAGCGGGGGGDVERAFAFCCWSASSSPLMPVRTFGGCAADCDCSCCPTESLICSKPARSRLLAAVAGSPRLPAANGTSSTVGSGTVAAPTAAAARTIESTSSVGGGGGRSCGFAGDCSWCTTAQVVMMVWHESSLMLVLELIVERFETFASWKGLMPDGGWAAAAASVTYSRCRRLTPFSGSFCICSIEGEEEAEEEEPYGAPFG